MISKDEYAKRLRDLQTELCLLQRWVQKNNKRVVIVFEGRDAAGKGGCIRAITERVNPRYCRVVALQKPTEEEKAQPYMDRYIKHLPSTGEIVIFDRSWYNRAGVEYVMEFEGASKASENRKEFFGNCCQFERELVDSGAFLIKFWLDVSPDEQRRRIRRRIADPMRFWKLSPIDLQSPKKWREYSMALNEMLHATAKDEDGLRWNFVDSNDKRQARLNCIAHVLNTIPYEYISDPAPELRVDISMYQYLMHDRPTRLDSHIARGQIDGVNDIENNLFEQVEYKKPAGQRSAAEWEYYIQKTLKGQIEATFDHILEKSRELPEGEAKAEYLISWSHIYGLLNMFPEGEELARRSLAEYEKVHPSEHVLIAETVDFLAEMLADQNKNSEAADLFERAYAIFEKNFGATDHRLSKQLLAIAQMYEREKNDPELEKVLERALALYQKPADEDLNLAECLSLYADLHLRRKNVEAEKAEALLRRALEVRERIQGADNIALADDLLAFAMICIVTGNVEESETAFKRLIQLQRAKLGPKHPNLANSLEGYAELLLLTGEESEAATLKEEAEAIRATGSNNG